MENILSQIYKVLVEPPGNLIYHLVIVFAAMAGLQTVFLLDSPANRRIANRMKIGFLVILAGQVFLFIVSALGWQRIIDIQLVLPLMDRLVIIISLIWIAWMVINPPSTKYTDLAVGILTTGAFIFFGFTLVTWSKYVGRVDFNGSPYDANWVVGVLLISVISGIVLAYFKPDNWGTGVGFFAIVFGGGVLQMAFPYKGSDYPAAVRLALICVFPLLPGIARAIKIYQRAAAWQKPLFSLQSAGKIEYSQGNACLGQISWGYGTGPALPLPRSSIGVIGGRRYLRLDQCGTGFWSAHAAMRI